MGPAPGSHKTRPDSYRPSKPANKLFFKLFIKKKSLAALFLTVFTRKMVGRDGFEPSTNWLKANCSTD